MNIEITTRELPDNGGRSKWTPVMDDLRVGESFFVPLGEVSESSLRSYAARWNTKHAGEPGKLTVRLDKVNDVKGFSVGKIARSE